MMKFLRSQSQTVLIVILAVIGLGFLFYGNSGTFLTAGGNSPTDFGRIEGQDLTIADLYGAVRNVHNMLKLQNQDQQVSQAEVAELAWEELVTLHEADKLHIDVTDDQLAASIQATPQFQKNGVYNPDAYGTFIKQLSDYRHISADTFVGMVRNDLRRTALVRALFSSIHAVGSDAKNEYDRQYGPVTLSYVEFPLSAYAYTGPISSPDIEAAYKAGADNPAFRSDEKRQVEYVLFPLTAQQQKLPDKDKQAAIQALGEKAIDFAQALEPDPNAAGTSAPPPADFDAEATKRGLTPITTNFFTASTPPAGLPPSPAFNNAAFALSKDNPVSKAIELSNGVAVLRLKEIQPSELRSLAEVTPIIVKQIQQQKATQAQQAAANAAVVSLKVVLAAGGNFKAAAAAQHMTVQTLAPLIPRQVSMDNIKIATLAYLTARLPVGAISQPIPLEGDNAVAIAHVDSRAPADPAGFADFETKFRQQMDVQLRQQAFQDWVNWQSKQPGTHRPPNLEAYGAVE